MLSITETNVQKIELPLAHMVLLFNVAFNNFSVIFACLFGLILNIPVNSYGHVGTVGSPNLTFFLGKLD